MCIYVNGKPVYRQKDKKSHEEIHWITPTQQALPQRRRCHLALWPGLIWFNSACSLSSACLPPMPVENMYHTGQETSRVTDTTPSVHAGSNLSLSCPGLQSVSPPHCLLIQICCGFWRSHQQLNGCRLAILFLSVNCRGKVDEKIQLNCRGVQHVYGISISTVYCMSAPVHADIFKQLVLFHQQAKS